MSTGLKANSDGSAAIQVGGTDFLTVTSGGNTTFTQPANLPNTFGFKNRIINGAMVIDQRNAGASVNPSTGLYTLDRYEGGGVHDGVLGIQRVADAPTGFVNSLRVTVTTADSSLGSTQYARVGQKIEGFNVADFAGGTANAATVTLSFWVKSTLTGTFGGYLSNGDETRIYVFQYTINAANTWEQKTVTVTLPSSGTWATDNTAGMRAFFSLGAGSSYVNTANTWLTSYAQQASGNVNVINTLNATWQITGVQLEKGSTATSFDYRPYSTELQLCQRYLPSFNSTGTTATVCSAFANSSIKARATFPFPVSARSAVTGVTVSAGSHFTFTGTTTVAGTSVAFHTGSTTAASFDLDGVSGLTAGQGGLIYCNNSTGYLLFTGCEL